MRIDDDYKIESKDPLNVVLYKRRIIQDEKSKRFGEEDWDPVGYYPTLKLALKRYCDLKINEAIIDYDTLIQRFDELMAKVNEIKG